MSDERSEVNEVNRPRREEGASDRRSDRGLEVLGHRNSVEVYPRTRFPMFGIRVPRAPAPPYKTTVEDGRPAR